MEKLKMKPADEKFISGLPDELKETVNGMDEEELKQLLSFTIPERMMELQGIVDNEKAIESAEKEAAEKAELEAAFDDEYRKVVKELLQPELNPAQRVIFNAKWETGIEETDLEIMRTLGSESTVEAMFLNGAKTVGYATQKAAAETAAKRIKAWKTAINSKVTPVIESLEDAGRELSAILDKGLSTYPVKGKPSISIPVASYISVDGNRTIRIKASIVDARFVIEKKVKAKKKSKRVIQLDK